MFPLDRSKVVVGSNFAKGPVIMQDRVELLQVQLFTNHTEGQRQRWRFRGSGERMQGKLSPSFSLIPVKYDVILIHLQASYSLYTFSFKQIKTFLT